MPIEALRVELNQCIVAAERLANESDDKYWTLISVDQEGDLYAEYEAWAARAVDMLRVSFDDAVYESELRNLTARYSDEAEPHDSVHAGVKKQLEVLRRIENNLPLWAAQEKAARNAMAQGSPPLRVDETWHRLREWTYGQTPSERLAALVLDHEGFKSIDPSHPLGGPDGTKDARCEKNGVKFVMAVYFPRGQQAFKKIQTKFTDDLKGVAKNSADALVFVTNQELTLSQREALTKSAAPTPVTLYHLESVATVLDRPIMAGVRRQFLSIDFGPSVRHVVDALEALDHAGRDEDETREAVVAVGAHHEKLLNRGVKNGHSRCPKCGSNTIKERWGDHDGRSFYITTCGDCGEHLGDCI